MIPVALLVIGLVAIASSGRGERGVYGPPSRARVQGVAPGPLAVLGQVVSSGRTPPPMLIMCAIAEAEATGRPEVASEIVCTFVAPVVHRHQAAAQQRRGQYARATQPQRPAPAPTVQQHQRIDLTDEQIRQALDANPQAFVSRPPGEFVSDVIDVEAIEQTSNDDGGATPAAELAEPSDPPISGVTIDKWKLFCTKLESATPVYVSNRHVGQYRQRKERLQELGIDPSAVVGSARAQRAALAIDLADAHHHVTESGLADSHVNRLIAVPGHDGPCTITLSGVLGVVQAAGLDGAVGWLENKKDRIKFPHTTKAFLNTNGLF